MVARLHADLEEMVSRDPRLLVMVTIKDHPVPEAKAKETSLLETITDPTNEDKTTRDILPESQEEEETTTNSTIGNQDKIAPTDPEVSIVEAKTEAIAAIAAVKTGVVTVVAASKVQEQNDFQSVLFQPIILDYTL